MQGLRRRFEARCSAHLLLINPLIEQDERGSGKALEVLIHSIAGLAGTLGYGRIGSIAVKMNGDFEAGLGFDHRDLLELRNALQSAVENAATVSGPLTS